MDKTLRFWVDVAYEHIKSDHVNLTKRQLNHKCADRFTRCLGRCRRAS